MSISQKLAGASALVIVVACGAQEQEEPTQTNESALDGVDAGADAGKGYAVEDVVINGGQHLFQDNALRVQKDGRIVVAGTITYPSQLTVGVARLWH